MTLTTNMRPRQVPGTALGLGLDRIASLANTIRKRLPIIDIVAHPRGVPIGLPEYARRMPNVRMTVCPWLCICAVCREYHCAEDHNRQLCFHDDFSPVIQLPAQVRAREIESVRPAPDSHETRIPTRVFLHAPSRACHHCVDWDSTGLAAPARSRNALAPAPANDRCALAQTHHVSGRSRAAPLQEPPRRRSCHWRDPPHGRETGQPRPSLSAATRR